jgi:hypothetical protein
MWSSCADETSSCSTLVSLSPYYEGYFYIGTQEVSDNLAIVQLTEGKLFYENKRVKKSLTLTLTTIEDSFYLRNEKSKLTLNFSGLCNKIKETQSHCHALHL